MTGRDNPRVNFSGAENGQWTAQKSRDSYSKQYGTSNRLTDSNTHSGWLWLKARTRVDYAKGKGLRASALVANGMTIRSDRII